MAPEVQYELRGAVEQMTLLVSQAAGAYRSVRPVMERALDAVRDLPDDIRETIEERTGTAEVIHLTQLATVVASLCDVICDEAGPVAKWHIEEMATTYADLIDGVTFPASVGG